LPGSIKPAPALDELSSAFFVEKPKLGKRANVH